MIARALSVVARSVALSWCCFGVVLLLLCGLLLNTVYIVGDRSKILLLPFVTEAPTPAQNMVKLKVQKIYSI
jgi:hypothetical protein